MLKTIVIVAALSLVEVEAFAPGVYFVETANDSFNQFTYLKYWNPYDKNSTRQQVTSGAYVLLRLLKELPKVLFRYYRSYVLRCQSYRAFRSNNLYSEGAVA